MSSSPDLRSIRNGQLLPVYLVLGEEHYLRDEWLEALRGACLSGAIADFNEDKFTAGEATVDKVLAAARMVPMMAPRRFVVVRHVERWESGGTDDGKGDRESPLDALATYAAAPVPSTCLVLWGDKLDGRRKLMTLAKKQGFLVPCDHLGPRELPRWIRGGFQDRGHECPDEVAHLLAEFVGPDLSTVVDAMNRLSLYVGPGQPVTEASVSDLIVRVRTADTWALVDAVGRRDLPAALRMFSEAFDPRDGGALPMVAALAWSVRQLAKMACALSEGASVDEAASRAGIVPAFRAREVAAKARNFRPKELERWLLVLSETDLALKSSRRPADAIVEEMLTRLCRR